MIGRLRRVRRQEVAELNITAFMNLMVVLVPFLLITAVFTQLAVKQLNLPDTSAPPSETPPEQGLTLTVRETELVLADGRGPIQRYVRENGRYNFRALNTTLAEIKERRPGEDRITLLVEPGIPYEIVIQAMDAVHYLPAAREGVLVDMFPRISIGEAPPKDAAP